MMAKRGTMVGLLLGSLMLSQMPAWAENPDGLSPEVADLKEALKEKDRELKALKERVERLEQASSPPEVVAQAQPPAPGPPAETPKTIGERLKGLEEVIKSLPLLSALKDWQLGGHVATSYNFNFENPNSRINRFRVFDDGANQVTLHQVELWLEKPTTLESPLGFGLDFVIGRDAKKIHALGLGSPDDVFDLTQAYVTYKAPLGAGLDLKAGKFVTLHGAEVIRRPANFNISRSLLFGFAIPFTHTGLMATYPFADWLTVTLGLVNGWDNADDNNTDKSLHGMATLTPFTDFTLTLSGTWGPEQPDRNGPKRGLIDVVATYKPIPPLTLIVNYDYGVEEAAVPDGVTGGRKTAQWQGIAAYAIYDLTDHFSIGIRGEFFIDEEGFRLGFTDPATGTPARLDLWELTLTARYKLLAHLFASLEYRHDQARKDRLVFDNGNGTGKDSQNTIAFELIYQF
ncbi:MAG: porin [Candidatus Methylomirabilales bacterium]